MTYIDTNERPKGYIDTSSDYLSWQIFTERRLLWLYGPDHKTTRAAKTQADLAAWRSLGSRQGEAA